MDKNYSTNISTNIANAHILRVETEILPDKQLLNDEIKKMF